MTTIYFIYLLVLYNVVASKCGSVDNSTTTDHEFWYRDPSMYSDICEKRPIVILSDYIVQGSIEEGLKAARVEPMVDGVESYAGYFRLEYSGKKGDHAHGREYVQYLIHFWYFPAEKDPRGAPVIFWVQGPRASSYDGLFNEHGPLDTTSGSFEKREFSWTRNNHVVYIEVFFDIGYSIDATDNVWKKNTVLSTGEDMYMSAVQFFMLFPDLAENDVFFAGEGYSSKVLLHAAYEVLLASENQRKRTNHNVNLKGLVLASPAIDPGFMVYAQHLAQFGLIDASELPLRLEEEKKFVSLYKKFDIMINYRLIMDFSFTQRPEPRPDGWNMEWHHYLDPSLQLFDVEQDAIPKNYLAADRLVLYDYREDPVLSFLERDDIQDKLHACMSMSQSHLRGFDHGSAYERLKVTLWYTDVSPMFCHYRILEHYRVLLYNGQQDVIYNYPNTQLLAKSLNCSSAYEYQSAKRQKWYVGEDLAGFFRSGGNLTVAMVMGAGQKVSKDKPAFAFDLVNRFVRNQPLKRYPSD